MFQDLLSNREEYLRGLRILLREIVRGVKQDMNFVEFALGLMKERTDSKFTDMEPQHKVQDISHLCSMPLTGDNFVLLNK